MSLGDIQNSFDNRGIVIDRVGIRGLSYPIKVKDRAVGEQTTIADVEVSVTLGGYNRGTHMSRFIEVMNDFKDEIHLMMLPDLLSQLKKRLETEQAFVKFRFPYFVKRKSPVTDNHSLSCYHVTLMGRSDRAGRVFLKIGASVFVTSVCPCSKEISDHGAHNQRSRIDLTVDQKLDAAFIWIEELIDYVYGSCSSPVWSLLKRPDEKHVTEKAYENPMFVEDMVRSLAVKLNADKRIFDYIINVISYESIHEHNAFAQLRKA